MSAEGLVEVLDSNIIEVTFYRKDGTEKTIKCTLMEPYVNEHDRIRSRTFGQVRVFLPKEEEWNMFFLENVKDWKVSTL